MQSVRGQLRVIKAISEKNRRNDFLQNLSHTVTFKGEFLGSYYAVTSANIYNLQSNDTREGSSLTYMLQSPRRI